MKLFVFLALFSFESHLAGGQNGDIPQAPTAIHCESQNLNTVVCSWDPDTNLSTTYTVCLEGSGDCSSVGSNTSVELQFPFKNLSVRIIARNSLGIKQSVVFKVKESNIVFRPYTPRMVRVYKGDSGLQLLVEWSDGGEMYSFGLNLLFQIQVIQTQRLKVVGMGNHSVTLYPGHHHIQRWSWTSPMPLQCTSHSVRVRSVSEEPGTLFSGIKAWSEWSPWSTLDGEDVSNNTSNQVYPHNYVIVEEGTDMMFCCVAGVGRTVEALTYHDYQIPQIALSNRSTAIAVKNLTFLLEAGGNVVCVLSGDIQGSVIYVGTGPDVPQNLTCETRNLKSLNCTWDPGRFTGLTGERKTVYTLKHGSKILECRHDWWSIEHYWCDYTLSNTNTQIYNFSLTAKNYLGKTQATISVNVSRVVHPFAPFNLRVGAIAADHMNLSWSDAVNYEGVWLICQIMIIEEDGKRRLQNYSVRGETQYKSHSAVVNQLRPNTNYIITARYAAQDFWKWSEWSNQVTERTPQAAPSVGVDLWRNIAVNSLGKIVTVFWKPLSDEEANGPVESYTVTWRKGGDGFVGSVETKGTSTQLQLDTAAYNVSVEARNQAGVSPLSTITIPTHTDDDIPVEVDTVAGLEDGFNVTWESRHQESCGYTVEWCQPIDCQPEWLKLNHKASHALIRSEGFKPGNRYRFSVFECLAGGDHLLKAQTGYTQQLVPSVGPEVRVKETGDDWIWLQWEDIPEDKLRGFIEGFNVYYSDSNTSSPTWLSQPTKMIRASERKMLKIKGLNPGKTYTTAVTAVTGGGEGPPTITLVTTLNSPLTLILGITVPLLLALTLGLMLSVFCYRKQEWIKETFYPDIPDPNHSKILQDQNFLQRSHPCNTLDPRDCTPNEVQVLEDGDLAVGDGEGSLCEDVPDDTTNTKDHTPGVLTYAPQRAANANTSGRTNPAFDGSSLPPSPPCPSQVTYSSVQSSGYQCQGRPGLDLPPPGSDMVVKSGYQPQIHSLTTDPPQPPSPLAPQELSHSEEPLPTHCGYKPQRQPNLPGVTDPQLPFNTPIGSPTSVNSQTFLLAEQEATELPADTRTWPLSSFFNT